MAASSVASYFSKVYHSNIENNNNSSLTTSLITTTNNNNNHPISLLICDRTFSTLHTTAQYLLSAPWIGTVIKTLTPFWNTDVAYDYLSSTCSKVVANDSNDKIIIHPASLQSGIAYYKEYGVYPNSSTTIPFLYRLSDYYYDDIHVLEQHILQSNKSNSSTSSSKSMITSSPVWPADKKISLKEAYHFAA